MPTTPAAQGPRIKDKEEHHFTLKNGAGMGEPLSQSGCEAEYLKAWRHG